MARKKTRVKGLHGKSGSFSSKERLAKELRESTGSSYSFIVNSIESGKFNTYKTGLLYLSSNKPKKNFNKVLKI